MSAVWSILRKLIAGIGLIIAGYMGFERWVLSKAQTVVDPVEKDVETLTKSLGVMSRDMRDVKNYILYKKLPEEDKDTEK